MFYKKLGTITIFLFLFIGALYAQEDVLVLDPFVDVDVQLIADTTTNGILPNRVYELKRDEFYLQPQIFNVPAGSTFRFRAEEGTGAKPVIYLQINSSGRPPGNWMVLNGGNLEVKDICIVGYFEDNWEEGLANIQGGLINTTVPGSVILLDGVVLSNVNGQPIRGGATIAKLQITNSIFANMGALSRSNLGAGKGIDLREVAHDTIIVVNTTFVNYQDRVIRHLDLGTGSPGAIKYLLFDHNTLINGMGYHGTLSFGSVGDQVILTNNLFVDAFALGEDSTDIVRSGEWLNTGETYSNGNNRMTWVLSVPNDQTQWAVSGNYYVVSPEGQAWLDDNHFGNGPFGIGSPLSYHINSKLGADSVNAITKIDLSLDEIPSLMTNMMTWYEDPAGGNRSKVTDNFVVARDDYDRRKVEYYRDTINASYSTSSVAYTGAEDNFPAGDLNWFPVKYQQWLDGIPATATINLSSTEINFDTLTIGESKSDSILISNNGGEALSISAISSDNAAFTFSPATLDIPSLSSAYLHITFTPADESLQSGNITLTHNATGSPSTIIVQGVGKTAVDVDADPNTIPKIFALDQNYPNPFNPSTLIEFALPKQVSVKLTVYNLLGEQVAELINEELPAGYYKTSFNGSSLSSGIYFYRIEAGSFVETRKLSLIK